MSHSNNTRVLEDAQMDLEGFISQRKWSDANAVLDNLWELGLHAETISLWRKVLAHKMGSEPREIHDQEEMESMDRDMAITSSADVW